MDEWLEDIGLYRKNTALDGSCLFRAVAEQLMPANPINGHLALRRQCCHFMRANRHLYEEKVVVNFDEYMAALDMPKGWGTVLELDAISRLYHVEFLAFFGPEKPLRVTKNGYSKELLLCVTGDSFFDTVYTKARVENLGFCQSIVYKILYEDVFKLNDLDYAVNRMLHDKAARALRERYLNQQSVGRDAICFESYLESPSGPVNVRQILNSGAILFPYKVAKALDPDIFRNIDFDNWIESQRGKPWPTHCLCHFEVTRRNNFWFGTGGPLRVGAKCHVRFEGQTLTGHIQELSADRGPALVFIEELSQKMHVSFEDLIAIPRSSLKPEWSYSHKHQMIHRFGQRRSCDDSPDRRYGGNNMANRLNQRYVRDESPDQRNGFRSRGRRVGRDTDLPGDSYSQTSTVAEADSTVVSPQSSPQSSSKTSQHSLIRTPDHVWAVVDKSAAFSVQEDCSDLPFDDLPTLRFFYNMGIEYFHKGFYFVEPLRQVDEPCYPSLVDSPPLVEMCQGAPLIQPPPLPMPPMMIESIPPLMTQPLLPPPMMVEAMPQMMMGPPPPMVGVTACPPPALPSQESPVMTTPASSAPPMSQPPPCMTPPPSPESPVAAVKIQETPTAPREGKERGRNSRFTKPPRFQRLESALKAAGAHRDSGHNEIQNPEISSCVPEPPQEYPEYTTPVPLIEPMQVSYIPDPDGNYLPPQEYPEYTALLPVIEPQQISYITDSEGNYSPYLYYTSSAAYYQ